MSHTHSHSRTLTLSYSHTRSHSHTLDHTLAQSLMFIINALLNIIIKVSLNIIRNLKINTDYVMLLCPAYMSAPTSALQMVALVPRVRPEAQQGTPFKTLIKDPYIIIAAG